MNGTRLSPDWQPSPSLRAWAAGRRPDLDITEAIEAFRDYWLALSGKRATKLDWDATFRNFIRSPVSNQARPQHAPQPNRLNPQPTPSAAHRIPENRNSTRIGEMLGGLFQPGGLFGPRGETK